MSDCPHIRCSHRTLPSSQKICLCYMKKMRSSSYMTVKLSSMLKRNLILRNISKQYVHNLKTIKKNNYDIT